MNLTVNMVPTGAGVRFFEDGFTLLKEAIEENKWFVPRENDWIVSDKGYYYLVSYTAFRKAVDGGIIVEVYVGINTKRNDL